MGALMFNHDNYRDNYRRAECRCNFSNLWSSLRERHLLSFSNFGGRSPGTFFEYSESVCHFRVLFRQNLKVPAMQVRSVTNIDDLKDDGGSEVTVVHFYADWSDECKNIDKVIETLSSMPAYSKVAFRKCAAETIPEISKKYDITAVPTIVFLKDGVKVDEVTGADPSLLNSKLQQFTKTSSTNGTPVPSKPETVDERLKKLINKGTVMVFMKGDRSTPRCGFSRQLIEILNETGVSYETFDILTDEEVRQGLKVYSDWPTYPQVYVKGELIGGLDIIKSMKEDKSLVPTLLS